MGFALSYRQNPFVRFNLLTFGRILEVHAYAGNNRKI